MKKKILVTGGSGFIGTNFCLEACKKNFVVNIDKLSYSSVPEKFKNISNKNYKFIKSNISNFKKINSIFAKYNFDCVVNFASDTHVDRSIDNPTNFLIENLNSNIKFFGNLLDLYKKKKLKNNFKLIHISTDEVYGSHYKPVDEKTNIEPNSPYSSLKSSLDMVLRSYGKTYNFPFIICRPSNNFGPFQFPEKFIPMIVTKFMNKKKIPLYGDGRNIREWIFVKDTCKYLLKICNLNQNFFRETFNLGSGFRIENNKLSKIIIKKLLNKKKFEFKNFIEYVLDRPGHDRSYSLVTKKINKILDIKITKTKFNNDISSTINWYLSNKKWLKYCSKIYKGNRLGL